MTLSGVCASASASVIPAGPPPTIATSGCRIVPDGMARASRNAFKAGLSVDYWRYGTRTVGSCLVAFVAERNAAVDRKQSMRQLQALRTRFVQPLACVEHYRNYRFFLEAKSEFAMRAVLAF